MYWRYTVLSTYPNQLVICSLHCGCEVCQSHIQHPPFWQSRQLWSWLYKMSPTFGRSRWKYKWCTAFGCSILSFLFTTAFDVSYRSKTDGVSESGQHPCLKKLHRGCNITPINSCLHNSSGEAPQLGIDKNQTGPSPKAYQFGADLRTIITSYILN